MSAPSSPYHLTFEHRPEYLYAYVEGDEDSYEISLSIWQKIAEEAERVGALKVLIDENISQPITMADVFQLASELPKMGFARIRVAFVDRHLDQRSLHDFGEMVAVNRGFNGKTFNDLQEAEDWLLA